MTLRLRHSILTGFSLIAVLFMVACGKKSETASVSTTTGIPNSAACQAGSTLVMVNGVQVCQGAGGLTSPVYNYNQSMGTTYASDNYCYRSLTVTNTAQNNRFMKEALGVCDNGYLSCSSFSPGLIRTNLISSNGQVAVQFFSYPTSQQTISQPMPSWKDILTGMMGFPVYNNFNNDYYGTFMPLSLVMSLFPINTSRGFETRSYGMQGSLAYNRLIQVQVAEGKVGDPYFKYGVAYDGVVFMTGTFVRSDNYNYYCGY